MSRAPHYTKYPILTFVILFDYINIAGLHNLINQQGIGSFQVLVNLALTLILGLDQMLSLFIRYYGKLKVYYGYESEPIEKSDYEKILLGIKIEIEMFAVLTYLFLLLGGYFYSCNNAAIIDCNGEPINTLIKTDHYILVIILFGISIIKLIAQRLAHVYNLQGADCAFIPQLNNFNEFFFLLLVYAGVNNDFSLPGLYSIITNF